MNRINNALFVVLLCACGGSPTPEPVAPESDVDDTSGAESAEPAAPPSTPELVPPGQAAERLFRIADDATAPMKGAADARVVVQIFSDFQCPYCARLGPTLHELEKRYGDRVRFVWRHFPLPFHEQAMPAAEAAVEVQAQVGSKGFWAYHDILFAQQHQLKPEQLVAAAARVEGVDAAKVAAALESHVHVPRVRADMQAALDSGAGADGFGTPATFINGRLVSGAQPFEAFEEAVQLALAETPEQRAAAEQASEAAYPMVRVSHVLVQYAGAARAPDAISRTREQALAAAQQIAIKARAQGADFAALAREHSDGPSGPDGGRLGWLTKGTLVPSFEEVAFALEPGAVSDAVETDFGFHVIWRQE